jgi:hypothetical protein
MGNPATLENEAPTKILGQKTFLRWVLVIISHNRIRKFHIEMLGIDGAFGKKHKRKFLLEVFSFFIKGIKVAATF